MAEEENFLSAPNSPITKQTSTQNLENNLQGLEIQENTNVQMDTDDLDTGNIGYRS